MHYQSAKLLISAETYKDFIKKAEKILLFHE